MPHDDLNALQHEELYDAAFRLANRDPVAAWLGVRALLARCPEHTEANILAGELALHEAAAIRSGTGDTPDDAAAERHFLKATQSEPRHADAWSGLGVARLYRGDPTGALAAAQVGLACLESEVGYLRFPRAVACVGERLYRTAAEALIELGRSVEAEDFVDRGLARFPESTLLRSDWPDGDRSGSGHDEAGR
jgi:hypothetical protein